MTMTDYIPHAAVGLLAAVAGWVFKSHDERDDARFKYVGDTLKELDSKLDQALKTQADNHAEILKLFIEQR